VTTIATALRAGAWGPAGFALEAGTRWMGDGTAAAIAAAKRRDAAARQQLLRTAFAGLAVRSDPRAYHAWWPLPKPWRAEAFVTAAARQGVAVTPAAAFVTGPGHAPSAVRLALGSPPVSVLGTALRTLAEIARAGPQTWSTE
jgi:DNA-binding transcriptional MocR family regulator